MLRGAADRSRAAGDEIVATAEAETGLPEARLRSELERTAGQLEAFAALLDAGDYVEAILDSADPDAKPIPRPDVRRMLVPIGPVAVFGASNFPLAFSTAGGDTASALAAGCPVVVKGHPSHPGTGELVAREVRAAVAGAGLPEGTFAHLLAAGIEVGEALVDAPADPGRRLHRLDRRRPGDHGPRRAPSAADPRVRGDGLDQPDRRDGGRAGRARRRDRRRAGRERRELRRRSCAPSPASSSCPTARAATRSPPTSPRGSTRSSRPCCSTSASATRSPAAVERLAGTAGVESLGSAPDYEGEGYRRQPVAFQAAGRRRGRRLAAARGALRARRAPAPLRGPRRPARRARPHRGAAHGHGPRRGRRRRAT